MRQPSVVEVSSFPRLPKELQHLSCDLKVIITAKLNFFISQSLINHQRLYQLAAFKTIHVLKFCTSIQQK